MKNNKSLRQQFKKQLAWSIGFLVVVFSVVLYQIFAVGIETTMHKTMQSLARHYVKQIEHDDDYPLPKRGAYTVFIGSHDLPPHIKEIFKVKALSDMQLYTHGKERFPLLSTNKDVHFLFVHPINHRQDKLYLVYNERPPRATPNPSLTFSNWEQWFKTSSSNKLMWNVPVSILAIIITAILLVYFVAHQLIRKVLNPLNELSKMAESINLKSNDILDKDILDNKNLNKSTLNEFEVLNDETEIGGVAKTLQKSIQSIQQYHQREKQFLQSASHELRTPIAVVSSALEIIELRKSNENYQVDDQHVNILRANKNMQQLTQALLLLSKKSDSKEYYEEVDLIFMAKQTISEHEYLLENKQIDVLVNEHMQDKQHPKQGVTLLPKTLCAIILSNLIRNAFEHTIEGKVIIEIKEEQLSVINTNATHSNYIEKNQSTDKTKSGTSHGFGLGLEIVKQIVNRQNWTLELTNSKSYTVVTVNFT